MILLKIVNKKELRSSQGREKTPVVPPSLGSTINQNNTPCGGVVWFEASLTLNGTP